MLSFKRAFAVFFSVLVLGHSSIVFAEEAGNRPSSGVVVHVDHSGDATLGLTSFDHEDRYLLISFDPSHEVKEIKLNVMEDTPLLTDRFLELNEIRAIEVDYMLEDPQEEYRIRRLLAIPVANAAGDGNAALYSAWHMELPYGMQDSRYLQQEWKWPQKHDGVVTLVEYENHRWGFFEITRSPKTHRTRVEFYEFEGPVPESSQELASVIKKEGSWPKFQAVAEYEFTNKGHYRDYFANAPTRDYRDDYLMTNLQHSRKYREYYDAFADSNGDASVVKKFQALTNLANKDYEIGLRSIPKVLDVEGLPPSEAELKEIELEKKDIDIGSQWAVFHFLSISSEKNLTLLWAHYEKDIMSLITLDPAGFDPRFYAKMMRSITTDIRLPFVFAEVFLHHFDLNAPMAQRVREDMMIAFRSWMIVSPDEVYAGIHAYGPSPTTMQLLKDVLVTVPHNKLDPKLLDWTVELILRSHGEVADTVAEKERLALRDLKYLKQREPNLWRAMMTSGHHLASPSCAQMISRL